MVKLFWYTKDKSEVNNRVLKEQDVKQMKYHNNQ